tara:strand:- start:709 stop:981 length:273 start_codon:yes stop_codon:yes gene_type:complete
MNGEWMTNWLHPFPFLLVLAAVLIFAIWFLIGIYKSKGKKRKQGIVLFVAGVALFVFFGLFVECCDHSPDEQMINLHTTDKSIQSQSKGE